MNQDLQDLATRREEARRAMEGDTRRRAREIHEQEIGRRRRDARLAMEGDDHRHRREVRERSVKELADTATKQAFQKQNEQETAEKLIRDKKLAEEKRLADEEAKTKLRQKEAEINTAEIEKLKNTAGHLSAIRTLKTDMAEAAGKGVSLASTMIRQTEKGRGETKKHSRIIPKVVITLILLGGMAFGGSLLYQRFISRSPTPVLNNSSGNSAKTQTSIVSAEHQTILETNGKTTPALIIETREIGKAKLGSAIVDEIKFVRNGVGLSFRAWQTTFGLSFSEDLISLIEPSFTFGFYHNREGDSSPFIVVRTRLTEQSYNQLLNWEKNLPKLWETLLGKPPMIISTPSTGTSTVSGIPQETGVFGDKVIQNVDVRIITGNGNQPAIYGFVDSETIILTTTQETFIEILNRFRNRRQ